MNPIKLLLQKELKDAGWHSRGYLPHFDGGELPQTINLHLADSLPRAVIERWQRELAKDPRDSIMRQRVDRYLDSGYGSCALRNKRVARMVQTALLHFDTVRYWLSAWVVMPNHVHVLLTPNSQWSLSKIMKNMKSYTAHEANKLLGRVGPFWMEDYFDRYIRNAKHFSNAIRYIENNPVKAGLVKKPSDWPFSSARFRQLK